MLFELKILYQEIWVVLLLLRQPVYKKLSKADKDWRTKKIKPRFICALTIYGLKKKPIQSVGIINGRISKKKIGNRVLEVLRETTSLSVGEMYQFMSQVQAWAIDMGVDLTHPQNSEYMKLQRGEGEH